MRQAYKRLVCPPAQGRWLGATGENWEIWAHGCTNEGWGSGLGAGPLVLPKEENTIRDPWEAWGSVGARGGPYNMVAEAGFPLA